MKTIAHRGGAIQRRRPIRPADSVAGKAPPGGLLSCYTASVACYLARIGAHAELAVGAQLYLAVRLEPDGAVAFVHHHTPLRGDQPTHRVELVPRYCRRAEVARERILAELRRIGAVVVAGNVATIPWQVGYGKREAPHWLVVDGANPIAGAVHVTDLFEFVGEAGEQESYEGWVSVDQLPSLAQPPAGTTPPWVARDRHAFGDVSAGRHPAGRHQWFEAVRPPEARNLSIDEMIGLLARTWAHHAGLLRRPDLPSPPWRCGVNAIRALADWLEPRLGEPATYAVSDDIWVAARNRQLFAHLTRQLASAAGAAGLAAFAGRAGELAAEWARVPQMLAYNVASMERGRAPRTLPATMLRGVADNEESLLDELGALVGSEAPR